MGSGTHTVLIPWVYAGQRPTGERRKRQAETACCDSDSALKDRDKGKLGSWRITVGAPLREEPQIRGWWEGTRLFPPLLITTSTQMWPVQRGPSSGFLGPVLPQPKPRSDKLLCLWLLVIRHLCLAETYLPAYIQLKFF